MTATAGKAVRLKLAGAAVAFTNEATNDAGDHKSYQISNAVKRVFDPQLAVVVQRSTDSGVTWGAAVGAYTLNRLSGTVTFASALGSTDLVRFASGSYLPMSTIAEGKSFSVSTKATMAQDIAFGDTDITKVLVQRMCDGSIGQWWLDNSFNVALSGQTVQLIEIAIGNGSTPIFRAWALLTERSHTAAAGGLQEEPLTWESTPDADFRSYAWLI